MSHSLGGVTTAYGYGTANDLLTSESVGGVQTQAIGYTADGRMNSFSPGIQAPGGQYITSLSYNQNARLSGVNAASGALASYTYDGFGNEISSTGSTPNTYLYRGEQWDPDLGLYYLRARYYNPLSGRFFSVDPLAGQGQKRYEYANADPVDEADPTGQAAIVEFLLLNFRGSFQV